MNYKLYLIKMLNSRPSGGAVCLNILPPSGGSGIRIPAATYLTRDRFTVIRSAI